MNRDDVLRDRLAVVKAQRDRAKGASDRAKEHSASNPNRSAVDRALQPHGERELHNWLGALRESLLAAIATIEVDDRQVRTQGSNDLQKAILARQNAPSSVRRRVLSGAPEEIRTPDPQIRSSLPAGLTDPNTPHRISRSSSAKAYGIWPFVQLC